jgi:hypothetical protein
MKIIELCDRLVVFEEEVKGEELVSIALNGFSSSWKHFFHGVCARENLPTFEKLWEDFIQKETRLEECCKYIGGAKSSSHQQDEKGQQERRTHEGLKREERGFKF